MIAALCSLGVVVGSIALMAGLPQGEHVPSRASQPEKRAHIKATLISEQHTVSPGSKAWIGLELEIEKDWHTYWNGRNDTGTPPAVKWTAPVGYKVGEFVWPAPKRHIQSGDTLDHVYEGRVLLMAPVEVPATAKPGDTPEIKASCTFVVCQDVCVMEKAAPTLTLKVAEGPPNQRLSEQQARFDQARKQVPVPLKNAKGVTAKIENGKLVVEAKGAGRVLFYPTEDSAGTPSLLKEGDVKGDRLTLTLEPSETAKRIRGVVEAREGALKEPVYVDVDLEVSRS